MMKPDTADIADSEKIRDYIKGPFENILGLGPGTCRNMTFLSEMAKSRQIDILDGNYKYI